MNLCYSSVVRETGKGGGGVEELEQRVQCAKTERREMDRLLEDYLPLIKATIKPYVTGGNFDDLLSVGMLAFVHAVGQYQPGRGGFSSFSRLCIRSRVLDDVRKNGKEAAKTVPLYPDGEDYSPADLALSMEQYNRQAERQKLADEISALQQELEGYGVAFAALAKAGPRQKRSQSLCRAAAEALLQNGPLCESFQKSGKLPQAELAACLEVSVKSIEKYRKYIVMLAVLLRGDYPAMRSFLPGSREGN